MTGFRIFIDILMDRIKVKHKPTNEQTKVNKEILEDPNMLNSHAKLVSILTAQYFQRISQLHKLEALILNVLWRAQNYTSQNESHFLTLPPSSLANERSSVWGPL